MTLKANPADKHLSNPMREARVKLGLTQEALSARSGIAVSVIQIAETKPISLMLSELSALANFLNIEPGKLFEFLHVELARVRETGQTP